MILRDYQRAAVDAVRDQLDYRPVLVAPTGSGKTVMGSTLVRELGRRTLWLAHRRELIQQAAERLVAFELRAGCIMAGQVYHPRLPVQVASVQTLVRRQAPPAELIVVDEAQHARASTYTKILDQYPGVPVVGLTATPFRLDGKGLGDIFGSLVVAAYPDELVTAGTLVEPVVFAPHNPDLSGVRIRHGEFSEPALAERMDRPKIIGNIVETWLRRAHGRRTVVFAVNVEHSKHIVASFRERGVSAEHLDGSTPKGQRDAILHRLRIGYTTLVSNCQVLTEGWDLPALEVAIIARPTASLCLHLQTIGRIMRAADGKTGAIVLDHAGNHYRHGPVTQRLEYSLEDGAVPVRQTKDGESPTKTCPSCFLVVPRGVTECPECGHAFCTEVPEHAEGELVQWNAPASAPRPSFEVLRDAWESIELRRIHLGFREGWSLYQFKSRFGFWPTLAGRELVDSENATESAKRAVWEQLEQRRRERGYKPGWTGFQFKAVFGHWPRWRATA